MHLHKVIKYTFSNKLYITIAVFAIIFTIVYYNFETSPKCFASSHLDEAQIYNKHATILAKQQKWFEALKYLQKAIKLNPFDESIAANLATIHNNIAIQQYLYNFNYSKALEHLKKASTYNPLDIEIKLNLISTYILSKNFLEAQNESIKLLNLKPNDINLSFKIAKILALCEELDLPITILQNILDKKPDFQPALLLLASLLLQNNNFHEAYYYVNQILEKDPTNIQAKEILKFIKAESKLLEESELESSPNFIVYYPTILPKEWIDEYLNILDEIAIAGEKFLGIKPQRKVIIILYLSNKAYTNLIPTWASGMYYDYKIRINLSNHSISPIQLKNVTAHEYCHHLVNLLSLGNCPVWLNEGLAQIFEGISIDSTIDILKDSKYYLKIESFSDLEKHYANNLSKDLYPYLYSYSFLLTHYLVEEYGIDAIRKLLSSLITPNSFEIAFNRIYNQSLHEFFVSKRQQIFSLLAK